MAEVNITPVGNTHYNRIAHAVIHADTLTKERKPCNKGVYLFECEGYIKVGIASDPRKRLFNAQTGNPFKIRLVAFKLMDNARSREQWMHQLLDSEGCHIRGEWFKVPAHLMVRILSFLT